VFREPLLPMRSGQQAVIISILLLTAVKRADTDYRSRTYNLSFALPSAVWMSPPRWKGLNAMALACGMDASFAQILTISSGYWCLLREMRRCRLDWWRNFP